MLRSGLRFALVAILVSTAAAAQTGFELIDIPDATSTCPYAINDQGTTVGIYVATDGAVRGFVRQADGTYEEVNAFGFQAWPLGINHSGTIVGRYYDGSNWNGFIKSRRSEISYRPSWAFSASVQGINNRGTFVGYAADDLPWGSFVVSRKSTLNFRYDSADITKANSINDAGIVVGSYAQNAGESEGFVRFPDGENLAVMYPDSRTTELTGINDRGQIVGIAEYPRYVLHGFGYSEGQFTAIDAPYPNAKDTRIYGINKRAQVCGCYTNSVDNVTHGFIANVPPRR